jgi:hypothetical protein
MARRRTRRTRRGEMWWRVVGWTAACPNSAVGLFNRKSDVSALTPSALSGDLASPATGETPSKKSKKDKASKKDKKAEGAVAMDVDVPESTPKKEKKEKKDKEGKEKKKKRKSEGGEA